METVIVYSNDKKGWPVHFTYLPDWMSGMNQYFYTFKGGNIFRHNVNETRNEFYNELHESQVRIPFNARPLENKVFKTIGLQSDAAWATEGYTDIQSSATIEKTWFEQKEGVFFANLRTDGTQPGTEQQYAMRSMNGIAKSASVTGTLAAPQINFSLSPLVDIGSILSVGDYAYFSVPPYTTSVLCGQVTAIVKDYANGNNYITLDATITGTSPIPIQTALILFLKNSVAESMGMLGHYLVATFTNDDTTGVELFAAQTEVMKSFP